MDQKLHRWKKNLRETNCPSVVLEKTKQQIRESQSQTAYEHNSWKDSILTGALTFGMLFLILAQWKTPTNTPSAPYAQSGIGVNQTQLTALQAEYSLALLGEAFINAGKHTQLLLSKQTDKPISHSLQTIQHLIDTKIKNHE